MARTIRLPGGVGTMSGKALAIRDGERRVGFNRIMGSRPFMVASMRVTHSNLNNRT